MYVYIYSYTCLPYTAESASRCPDPLAEVYIYMYIYTYIYISAYVCVYLSIYINVARS